MTIVAAGLALVAAALFAVAAAAQQRAAAQVPDERARGLGVIRVLVRRPLWWVGTGGDLAGYAAQAAALGLGSLVLVQPLLVTTLLFALPLAAWWSGRRLSRADAAWALALSAALALFVVVAEPTAGVDRAAPAALAARGRGARRAAVRLPRRGGRAPGRGPRGAARRGHRAALRAHGGADEGRGQPARRRRPSRWSPPGRRPR